MRVHEKLIGSFMSAGVLLLVGVFVGWSPRADATGDMLQEAERGETLDRGQEAAAEIYRGSLGPVNGSGVEGEVVVQRKGEQLSVRVNARGLSSGQHGQHIHDGDTCESPGGIAVPLDNSLGEIESGFGGEFPATEGESGTLTYNQKGSNPDFAELDLANSTVVVHAGVPGAPVACAPLAEQGE